MKKALSALAGSIVMAVAMPIAALAHVVVTPSQVGVGEELVFSISVPNERSSDVTSVKLDVPSGVGDVTPTVAPGWTITTDKSGDDVRAITWTGTIPVGQRQDFSFGVQAPAKAGQLDWKAYQTYADGTIVHWDQKPTGSDDADGNAGPYSVTDVSNDIAATTSHHSSTHDSSENIAVLALVLAAASIGLTLIGQVRQRRSS